MDFDNYVSRYRLLESRLEETVQQTMKIKEEKISSLEKKVEESNAVNATLLADLASVRTDIHILNKLFKFVFNRYVFVIIFSFWSHDFQYCFLIQTHQMLSALGQQKEDQNSHQHQRSEGSATAELLRLKDHLIDVEKNVLFLMYFFYS